MISQNTVREVLETAQVEEVIGDFLNLKRRGSNLVGLCPFHDEKSPSFNVNPTRNIYKCFGCGRGGDPVSFIMEHENYSFPDAIRWLAAKYNIQIEEKEVSPEARESALREESYHLLMQYATSYYQKQMLETQKGSAVGLSYFKERGYREGLIKKFELGYSPDSGDAFLKEATAAGYNEESLRLLGLITEKKRDFFRGRVMFPIHNISGKVIALAGRALGSTDRGPKYINSPESPIYKKSKVLYGLHQARNSIRKEDKCYLVEGYTDVLTLFQNGIENVVASSGTALTADQVRSLKRFTPNITILYDGDMAGLKAAMRGMDIILAEDMHVRLVIFPDKEDPDSFMKSSGQDVFLSYLKAEEKDFILFKSEMLQKDSTNDPIRKAVAIKEIITSISLVPDAIKRAMYLKQCAAIMDIEERTLIIETNAAIRSNLKQERLSSPRQQQDTREEQSREQTEPGEKHIQSLPGKASDIHQERDLLRILIQDGAKIYDEESGMTVAEFILTNLEDVLDTIKSPAHIKVLDMIIRMLEEGRAPKPEDFVRSEDQEIKNLAVEILSVDHHYSENWLKKRDLPLLSQAAPEDNFQLDSIQAILRFKLKKIIRKVEENQELIKQFEKEGDQEKLESHIKIHYELLKIRDQITQEFQNVVLRV